MRPSVMNGGPGRGTDRKDCAGMYVVVIGVFAIVLTISQPLYRLVTSPTGVTLAVVAATAVPVLAAALVTRAALRELDRYPETPSRGQFTFHRGLALVQALIGVGHAAVLLTTDWLPMCARLPTVGDWVVVPSLLALSPFLATIVLAWIALFPADQAVRQIAVEAYLYRGRPVRPVWGLGQYLQYNLRHQVLFVLVPMVLILLASDVVLRYERPIREFTGQPYTPDVLIGLATMVVAVIAPEILRHVWVTQRLPDGPLRDRLLALCRALRLRCRDILVWRSGGMVVNAAVMGVVAPLRYVLITDAMLEQMEETKIEAVFGHEAGHVKHRHIQCFLLLALISGALVTVFLMQTRGLARTDYARYQLLVTLVGLGLLIKWGLVFGWISRRFERQADVFAVRALTRAGLPCTLPCALHSPGGNPGRPMAGALCATAAHVLSHALYEVALLNGIRPEARSWRHSSIASRSRFLLALADDPRRARRFQRTVLAVQLVIVVAAIGSALWAAHELNVWAVLGQRIIPGVGRRLWAY